MSILGQNNPIPTMPTTLPSTLPSTLPTFAPTQPVAAYIGAILFWGMLLVLGLLIGWRLDTGPKREESRWSPPRWLVPIDAGKLWIGALAMIWCFLAVPMLAVQFLGSASDASTQTARLDDAVQVGVLLTTYLVGLFAVALLHGLWKVGTEPVRLLGLRLDRPRMGLEALCAVWITVPLTMLAATVNALLWQEMGWQRESAHQLLQLMGRNETSPLVLVVTILNAAILAPVFEEVLFRGHLQSAIASLTRSRWPAIGVTSVIFAIIHPTWTAVPIFVLSVAIGYAYERTGSLWVPILVHVAFNSISTGIYLVAR